MATDSELLQNDYLNALRKNGARVSIFLMNGERLDGQIKSFDMYSVSVHCPEPRLVVKTSIASVQPAVKRPPSRVRAAPLTAASAVRTPAKAPVIERKVRRVVIDKR